MTTFEDVRVFINSATIEQAKTLSECCRNRFLNLVRETALTFLAGDRICFTCKDGTTVHGIFIKLNQKNAKIKADSGAIWTVAPSLLKKSSEPIKEKNSNTVNQTLPNTFRLGSEFDLICPHRDITCCEECVKKHPEIREVHGKHFWNSGV